MKGQSKNCITARFVKGSIAAITIALVALGAVPLGAASPTLAAAATSSGCSGASPGSTTLSLNVNGFTRTVIVHVPKSSNGTTPLALVLNLCLLYTSRCV